METFNTDISQTPQPFFSRAFAYDGRISRLEYFLSFVITIIVIFAVTIIPKWFRVDPFNYDMDNIEESLSTELIVQRICFWIHCIAYWFMWAQATKRCHDMGQTGWIQFIPFYNLRLFFVDSNSNVNRYGYPPKQMNSVDNQFIHNNILKEKNILVSAYLLLMLLFNSGSLTEITYYLRYLDVLFKNSTISELIIPIISIFVHIVALCGLALVFHYKKIGFYIATIALGIIIILWIYNLYTYASTNPLFKTPYDIFNFIISFISSFGIIALYPILNIRQNGETIWPKMEISLTNTDWKSFFQYLLTFEMANLVIYLSNMV